MTQTLQGKLHEWEAASSEALDGFDTQSRQPCNVVEQSPVSLLRTAGPDKHTHALKLPPWGGQAGSATPPGPGIPFRRPLSTRGGSTGTAAAIGSRRTGQ